MRPAFALAALLLLPTILVLDASAEEPAWDLVLDASHLPAATGWFAAAVTVDADSRVAYEVTLRSASGGSIERAAMIILGLPWSSPGLSGGSMGGAHEWLDVAARGERVSCCASEGTTSVGGGMVGTSHEIPLRAGEVVWVGLAAVNWAAGGEFEAAFRASDANLVVLEIRSGTDVALVDLATEAHRAGLGVRSHGARVVGEPGEATVSWTPKANGFLAFWALAEGTSEAVVSVTTPAGIGFDNHHVKDSWSILSARGSGEYVFEVKEVRETSFTLVGADRPLSLLALLVDADLPGHGLFTWTG